MKPERPERGGPTEANGDSWCTNERGPSFVGSFGSSCRYERFLSCLRCSSQPSTKYCIPHRALFIFLCPHPSPSNLGWQSCRVAYLLICVSACILEYSNCKRGPCCFPPSSLCLQVTVKHLKPSTAKV
jgi:hypothetical protein